MTRHRGAGAALLLAVLLAWLVAEPLVIVLLEAVRAPSGVTLDHVRAVLAQPVDRSALWGSLWISLASVAAAGVVGVPLAWVVTRYALPGRRWLVPLLGLPVALPPLIGVLAFLFLYGESGFAGHLVRAVFGLEETPWRLQGAGAVLLVHAYAMYPFFFLFTRAALLRLDGALLEAAAGLGATRWQVARAVVLPALRPALAGAALLTFMTSLASFSAPYIFGGGLRVMTTQIVATRLNGDDVRAMAQTLLLALGALGALLLFRRIDPPEASGASGRASRPLVPVPPRHPRLLAAAVWALAVVLVLPHATLALVSFVPAGTWTTEAVPPMWTARNYLTLLADPVRFAPLVTSLWMATVATAGAIALAFAGSWLAVRRRVALGGTIELLLALPWAVPGTVFAIALATTFSLHQPLAGRFVLVGTLWLLPLAWLVRDLPIAARAIGAGVRRLDPAYEEAAASLGAGRWRTLRHVTLPLLRPALVAGGALAFVTAFGDFVTSIVLYSYHTRPVSLEILASVRQSDVGVAAAYGVVLTAISAAVFAMGQREEGTP